MKASILFRILMAGTGMFLLSVFAIKADGGEQPPSRPNIVFIYADDWGWGDLACHGHPELKTPNIDRLAAQGIDFHRFTVGSPVCSPSRVTIMTGNFPARHQIHTAISKHDNNVTNEMPDWLDPDVTLLPRLLKEAGYTTGHFGKWHLSLHGQNVTPETPLPEAYGFDEAAIFAGPGRKVWENSSYADRAGEAFDPVASSYITAAAAEQAIRFITAAKDRPFFVNLWIHETHTFVSATAEDKKAYPNTPEPQRTYYSAITRADRIVGEVLATIKELGLEENTIVIFSSDNGPEDPHTDPNHVRYSSVGSTGGLRGQKRSLYLGGVNTPFIVRWPGHIPAGKVDAQTVIAGVDILPTLLAATEIPLPKGYKPDGQNVMKAFEGKKMKRKAPLFWEWRGPYGKDANWAELAMLHEGKVLLIAADPKRIELYDIFKDPQQQNNLAETHSKEVNAMEKELRKWKATLPGWPPGTN